MFFFAALCSSRALYSFPTRRSSDLFLQVGVPAVAVFEHGLAEKKCKVLVDFPAVGLESRRGLCTFFPDRKSTRLNSSHRCISYAVFCLKKKKKKKNQHSQ